MSSDCDLSATSLKQLMARRNGWDLFETNIKWYNLGNPNALFDDCRRAGAQVSARTFQIGDWSGAIYHLMNPSRKRNQMHRSMIPNVTPLGRSGRLCIIDFWTIKASSKPCHGLRWWVVVVRLRSVIIKIQICNLHLFSPSSVIMPRIQQ